MEKGRPHCLVLSFPLQGHINPMFQFSKRLKHSGIPKITLVTTKFFLKSVQNFPDACFPVETISDGFDDGGVEAVKPEEAFSRCSEFGSRTLAELVEKLRSSGSPADCVIYDPFYPWVLDVAEKFGLMTAIFFTQPNSVNCIYFNAYRGEMKLPVMEDRIRIPYGFPVMDRSDLPSFIRDYESDPKRSEIMMEQFRNVQRVDWVFVNTFHQLEQEFPPQNIQNFQGFGNSMHYPNNAPGGPYQPFPVEYWQNMSHLYFTPPVVHGYGTLHTTGMLFTSAMSNEPATPTSVPETQLFDRESPIEVVNLEKTV